MSSLSVYHHSTPAVPNKVLTHGEDIAATLAEVGVVFEHWPTGATVVPGASSVQVTELLGSRLDELMTGRGYVSVEVLSLDEGRSYQEQEHVTVPDLHELCASAAEAYLLVAGRALCNLHIDDHVYAVLCERGDLLSLPAGTRYWFDAGVFPRLIALHMRKGPAASITGHEIASRFPRFED